MYCEDDGDTYNNILSNTYSFTPYPNARLLWSTSNLSVSKSDNEIRMKVYDQSDYLWNEYVFYLYKDDTFIDTLTVTAFGDYVFSGLEDGTYKLVSTAFYKGTECCNINSDNKTFDFYQKTSYFVITANRPEYFYWDEDEKNAFLKKGATTILTAVRWNVFIDNINEILKYKGLTSVALDSDMYGVKQGTYMNDFIKQAKGESNEYITANKFNIARHSIGAMKSTGIGGKYSGDEVIGSEFITLQNILNEVL